VRLGDGEFGITEGADEGGRAANDPGEKELGLTEHFLKPCDVDGLAVSLFTQSRLQKPVRCSAFRSILPPNRCM
jgi:hypothetical protein